MTSIEDDDHASAALSSSSPSSSSPLQWPLPLARHHSYLQGALHPVYDQAQNLGAKRSLYRSDATHSSDSILKEDESCIGYEMERNKDDTIDRDGLTERSSMSVPPISRIQELPVVELDDIVLFPGATIPLRWSNHSFGGSFSNNAWNRLLASRTNNPFSGASVQPIRMGILCSPTVARMPASLPTRRFIYDNGRFRFDGVTLSSRRESWTRQGHGPRRLRRFSQQLIAELGQGFSYDEDESENGNGSDSNNAQNDPAQPLLASNNVDPSSRRGRSAAVSSLVDSPSSSSTYIGRIGTIATVLFMHGDEATANGANAASATAPTPVVVTAVTAMGTSRFEIVAYRSADDKRDYHRNDGIPGIRRSHGIEDVKYFIVEELKDDGFMAYPRNGRHQVFSAQTSLGRTRDATLPHDCQLQYLSMVSPNIPLHTLRRFWPYRLVDLIRQSLRQSAALSGLKEVQAARLPRCVDDSAETRATAGDRNTLLDPVAFSFWLAANLPLSLDEKLQLLEVRSTVERLLMLHDKVAPLSQGALNDDAMDEVAASPASDILIHCRNCLTPVSRAQSVFTVDGAEGTSGNYVNAHGVVHQTITLRQINEEDVWYQGGPETQDSWFPGYSWTIMACCFCRHHLGWKFCRVVASNTGRQSASGASSSSTTTLPSVSQDRPDAFYGLSAANIDMFVRS